MTLEVPENDVEDKIALCSKLAHCGTLKEDARDGTCFFTFVVVVASTTTSHGASTYSLPMWIVQNFLQRFPLTFYGF